MAQGELGSPACQGVSISSSGKAWNVHPGSPTNLPTLLMSDLSCRSKTPSPAWLRGTKELPLCLQQGAGCAVIETLPFLRAHKMRCNLNYRCGEVALGWGCATAQESQQQPQGFSGKWVTREVHPRNKDLLSPTSGLPG